MCFAGVVIAFLKETSSALLECARCLPRTQTQIVALPQRPMVLLTAQHMQLRRTTFSKQHLQTALRRPTTNWTSLCKFTSLLSVLTLGANELSSPIFSGDFRK